jgi:uncharacterized glyoxalase superfamily protein PhnB
MHHLFAVAALLLGLAGNAWSKDADWPELPAPGGAKLTSVTGGIVLNGHRGRILQVDASGDTQALLAFYREHFGARRVENKIGDTQVIATQQGSYFYTVQVRKSGLDMAQATVMMTLLGQKPSRSTALNDTQSWLPTETRTLQTMEADDAGTRSITLTALNRQSLQTNRGLVLEAAEQRGFRLTREDKLPVSTAGARDGVSLWLSARSEQAIVTVVDTGEQRALTIVRTRQVQ